MVAILAEPRSQMRAMRIDDIDAVAAIEAVAYEFPWTLGIFGDCLRAGYECWVLQRGEEVLGYGILSVAAGEAHLLNACIAPAHQGRGHGRHLVGRMIELARWHRVQRIFLEVRPSNLAAVALYPTLGFNEIAVRPNYYPAKHGREDAIVMAMELLPPES
ncbi:MAG: ribosomal protein S18-alanine N-acetyltransferase [Proteobacteria bacterium]|nr:ribosomal protein S18-alanine N-acetyltransferase [Pseudomonadota bacterium]